MALGLPLRAPLAFRFVEEPDPFFRRQLRAQRIARPFDRFDERMFQLNDLRPELGSFGFPQPDELLQLLLHLLLSGEAQWVRDHRK